MNKKPHISYASDLGIRAWQEDYLIQFPFQYGHLIAVMDGHGGEQTSEFCAKEIPKAFRPDRRNMAQSLQKLVSHLAIRTQDHDSGCTISIACILEKDGAVVTAVVGDSPIIVVDSTGRLRISKSHNVQASEKARGEATRRGGKYQIHNGHGYIYDGGRGLQISRSLGDRFFGQIITKNPSISTIPINNQSVIVVASDGILDPDHPKRDADIAKKIAEKAKSEDANSILNSLKEERILRDNTTIVVYRPL